MWFDFFAGVAIGVIALFAPGFLICKALGCRAVDSVAFAPLVAVAVYAGLGCLYPLLGLGCSWVTAFVPLLAVGLVGFGVRFALTRKARKESNPETAADVSGRRGLSSGFLRSGWLLLASYIAFGILFTGFIFVKNLNGADAFSVEIDNTVHYGLIRDFLESGNWSSIGGSFYPSAMHAVAALIGSVLPTKITLLSNVTLTLFIAFVFPAGMFAFMNRVFPQNRTAVAFGMLAAFCFAAFPWRPLAYGPMTPFLLSLCLLPAILAAFMDALAWKETLKARGVAVLLGAFGLLAGILMQTSVVFTVMVTLLPFCISQIVHWPHGQTGLRATMTKALAVIGVVVAFLLIWGAGLVAPFLQGVISFDWPPITDSLADGLMQTVLFGQQGLSKQMVLGLLVAIGFVMALAAPRLRWVAFPYLFMAIGYFVVAALAHPIERVLTGFWYTDPIRLAANMSFFAIPLASLALGNIAQSLKRRLEERFLQHGAAIWIDGAIAVVFLACVFSPLHLSPNGGLSPAAYGEGGVRDGLAWEYSTEDTRRYTAEESEFVQKALAVTGDALVLNNPYDGSCYAWGIDGIRVLYSNRKLLYDYDRGEGSIVRNLAQYAANEEVQEAVRRTGAKYVLQLDRGNCMEDFLTDSDEEQRPYVWGGIDSIDESTPGFKLVLQDGPMKLYEIEELA